MNSEGWQWLGCRCSLALQVFQNNDAEHLPCAMLASGQPSDDCRRRRECLVRVGPENSTVHPTLCCLCLCMFVLNSRGNRIGTMSTYKAHLQRIGIFPKRITLNGFDTCSHHLFEYHKYRLLHIGPSADETTSLSPGWVVQTPHLKVHFHLQRFWPES